MGVRGAGGPPVAADVRAAARCHGRVREVGDLWRQVSAVDRRGRPADGPVGRRAPGRGCGGAVLGGRSVEFELARRMAAASRSGSLPLVGDGAMLLARGWSATLGPPAGPCRGVRGRPSGLGGVWASGVITSEHVHALARHADRLEVEEMVGGHRGARPVVGSALAVGGGALRAAGDPGPAPARGSRAGRVAAHEGRSLSFALTVDSVVLSGVLPRLEGEAVIAAVEAFAERLRSRGRSRPGVGAAGRWAGRAGQRRARLRVDPDPGWAARLRVGHPGIDSPRRPGVDDVPRAHPHRRGAAVHRLRRAGHPDRDRHGALPGHRRRVPRGHRPPVAASKAPTGGHRREPSAAARITALATTLLGTRIPLAVGRTAGPPPRPSAGPSPPATRAASSRAVGSPPRPARRTTSRTGPPAGTPTYPTWRCCAGRITARSTWACGPSSPPRRRPGTPTRTQARHPEPPGPPTTAHPGPSPEHPEHAGGCEVAASYRTTTFTRFDHFDQPLEFFTRTAE